MSCSWRWHRRAVNKARKEAREAKVEASQAKVEKAVSEVRNENAKDQARRSSVVSARLRAEVEKNHFTELLLAAMERGR